MYKNKLVATVKILKIWTNEWGTTISASTTDKGRNKDMIIYLSIFNRNATPHLIKKVKDIKEQDEIEISARLYNYDISKSKRQKFILTDIKTEADKEFDDVPWEEFEL